MVCQLWIFLCLAEICLTEQAPEIKVARG